MTDKDWEMLYDAIQGECPMCGGNVALGHCLSCGEPTDPISKEENYEND
jgi:hypothetical protein